MTAVVHLPKAAPRHCTCSKVHIPAARRAYTGRSSRLHCNRSGSSEHSKTAGTSDQGQEATASQQQERFVSVSDLLAEVSGWITEHAADLTGDLVVNLHLCMRFLPNLHVLCSLCYGAYVVTDCFCWHLGQGPWGRLCV